jgi:hypothetical protein
MEIMPKVQKAPNARILRFESTAQSIASYSTGYESRGGVEYIRLEDDALRGGFHQRVRSRALTRHQRSTGTSPFPCVSQERIPTYFSALVTQRRFSAPPGHRPARGEIAGRISPAIAVTFRVGRSMTCWRLSAPPRRRPDGDRTGPDADRRPPISTRRSKVRPSAT